MRCADADTTGALSKKQSAHNKTNGPGHGEAEVLYKAAGNLLQWVLLNGYVYTFIKIIYEAYSKQRSDMFPRQLTLLRSLVLWALNTSDAVSSMLKENYKVSRHEDDMNISLSVQSWGRDGQKHRFWLVEGQDDTSFRVYRESTTALWSSKWKNVAGSIDELREVADKLGKESAQASRRLSENMMRAIPRFEATEEVWTATCCIAVIRLLGDAVYKSLFC